MESKVSVWVGRRFYLWAALACGLIAVGGFAQSYYLKTLFETPALPTALHLHGIVLGSFHLIYWALGMDWWLPFVARVFS